MIRLFQVFFPTSVIGLFLTETCLIAACYFGAYEVVSVLLMPGYDLAEVYYLYDNGLMRTLIPILTIQFGLYLSDLYTKIQVRSKIILLQEFSFVIGIAFILQALLSYVGRELIMPRWQMLFGSGFALVLLPSWRVAYGRYVMPIIASQRVLMVGSNNLLRTIAATARQSPEYRMEILGYLSNEEPKEENFTLGPWLGKVGGLLEVYERLKPDCILVGMKEQRGNLPVNDLLTLRLSGVRVEDACGVFETMMWRVPVEELRPSQLLFTSELGPRPNALLLQRFYSLVIAVIGTVLSLPIMLLVWLAVRLTSKGPALFRQTRVGLNGRIFELYKFRSMYMDAEARTGAVWATRNDPRVTPLGRWLRKLRLDELPQFFNVLKGDMAIVGPRPERPEFVKVLTAQIPFYGQRHAILPGITGWAQINHKYGDTVEDTITKLEYDLYYLKNLSLSLDMYIIFNTIKVMLLSKGSQ
jgi:sugar transferase (PEP-CTERM system associated)